MPYGHWEEDNTSDRQNLLEKAAEERHQKLQELKEAEFDQQMLLEREQRIQQIESDMIDVNQIMKELSAMVQEQGEHLSMKEYCYVTFTSSFLTLHFCLSDSIENNIDRTYTHVEDGRQELEKASSHQVLLTIRLSHVSINYLIVFSTIQQRTHRKWLCFLTGVAITVAGIVSLVIYLELRST